DVEELIELENAKPTAESVETEGGVIESEAAVEPDAPAAEAVDNELPVTTTQPQPTAASDAQPTPSQAGLVIGFSGNCWVQVSVPGGRVLQSSQMQQGQTLNIDQQGPLDLVIGAAGAVSRIEYN